MARLKLAEQAEVANPPEVFSSVNLDVESHSWARIPVLPLEVDVRAMDRLTNAAFARLCSLTGVLLARLPYTLRGPYESFVAVEGMCSSLSPVY